MRIKNGIRWSQYFFGMLMLSFKQKVVKAEAFAHYAVLKTL